MATRWQRTLNDDDKCRGGGRDDAGRAGRRRQDGAGRDRGCRYSTAHVVAAAADLVDALTARLPRLRVLATSREPLWVQDELSYRLAPLSVVGQNASLEEIAASPASRLVGAHVGRTHFGNGGR